MELYVIVTASLICVVMAGMMYVKYREEQAKVTQKIIEQTPRSLSIEDKEEDGWKSSLLHWCDKCAEAGKSIELMSDPEELKDYLIKAGRPYGLTIDRLQGAKIVGTVLFGIGGLLYYLLGLPFGTFAVFAPLIGYIFPIQWVKSKAKKRQLEIQFELPDFLDMMSITLKAGMSLDSALEYFVGTQKGPLSEEIMRMNQEISFGVQRETAYRSLISRTDSPDLEALIQSMIQAHNLGTPISETFAQQASEMRTMRAEKAKEQAGKSEPKISAIAGLILTPSIMILVFGVMVLQFMQGKDKFF
ncbi:tight adherence protein C [Marininema mesophilum]|uniref:Tight adherence protein C n=1 Tax=Marininema mesophilum TaxID=1048340 RepID=A0A1H2X4R6_9BACL|nr:type II secretion system F family protein [Marininema mesophilum]SDW87777.1 tight adherence protein C [Marininema mesophilum]